MALLRLLQDLNRLHQWHLHLWHGDHGWHDGATTIATDLASWIKSRGWSLTIDRADPLTDGAGTEAGARSWRYDTLLARARQLDCSHVVTGHTASDRAETLVLNLARGSHRRGLASLRPSRSLAEKRLPRPLLIFSRQETAAMARRWELPVWWDPSNEDLTLERNRLRMEVMPILDRLHPGVEHRLAALAERLADEEDGRSELTDLALDALRRDDGSLDLERLRSLGLSSQRRLVQAWLERHTGRQLKATNLEWLLARLASRAGSGTMDLAGHWRLHWRGHTLSLTPSSSPPAADDPNRQQPGP